MFGRHAALAARVELLERTVERLSTQLDVVVRQALTDWQYVNLSKIATGRFGRYVLSAGLRRDLDALSARGYVTTTGDIPSVGDELCRHVEPTQAGLAILAARNACSSPIPLLVAGEVISDGTPHRGATPPR